MTEIIVGLPNAPDDVRSHEDRPREPSLDLRVIKLEVHRLVGFDDLGWVAINEESVVLGLGLSLDLILVLVLLLHLLVSSFDRHVLVDVLHDVVGHLVDLLLGHSSHGVDETFELLSLL